MILFKKEMAELVLAGKKTQTRRFWKQPRVKVGSVHQANLSYTKKAGFNIRILGIHEAMPLYITEQDAKAEGFENSHAFWEYFDKLNLGRKDIGDRKLYAVEFELAEVTNANA